MNNKELKQFLELYDKFEDRCNYICRELSSWDEDFKFVDQFYIEDNSVRCEGDEYWNFGGHEHHTKYFDIDLLSYTDKELYNYVYSLISEETKKKAKEKAEKLKYEREKELKELQRLKEKYEK